MNFFPYLCKYKHNQILSLMQLKLTFDEIGKLIYEKTGKELPLVYGGPHTVRVSYKVPLMGPVGLDITVDRIEEGNIYLSYGGGKAIEFMVRTAFKQFDGRPEAEIVQLLDDNRFAVLLGKIPQAGQILEHIDLQDIHFDERSAMIDFAPKGM